MPQTIEKLRLGCRGRELTKGRQQRLPRTGRTDQAQPQRRFQPQALRHAGPVHDLRQGVHATIPADFDQPANGSQGVGVDASFQQLTRRLRAQPIRPPVIVHEGGDFTQVRLPANGCESANGH